MISISDSVAAARIMADHSLTNDTWSHLPNLYLSWSRLELHSCQSTSCVSAVSARVVVRHMFSWLFTGHLSGSDLLRIHLALAGMLFRHYHHYCYHLSGYHLWRTHWQPMHTRRAVSFPLLLLRQQSQTTWCSQQHTLRRGVQSKLQPAISVAVLTGLLNAACAGGCTR